MAAIQILQGTLCESADEECHQGVRELITEMAVPEGIRACLTIDTFITEGDFSRKGILGWKEQTTSTFPSIHQPPWPLQGSAKQHTTK